MHDTTLTLLFFVIPLAACDPALEHAAPDATSLDDGGVAPSACPALEPACELGAPAELEVGSLFLLDLADLAPVAGVDSVALRIDGGIRTTMGAPCASASDATACEAAVAALPEAEWAGGLGNACALPNICEVDLVVTRGDEVFVVDTLEGLIALFGPIDSLTEAALLGFATRPPSSPAYTGYEVIAVSASGDGYELLVRYLESDCDPIVSRSARLHVAVDAAINTACDRLTWCSPAGHCI